VHGLILLTSNLLFDEWIKMFGWDVCGSSTSRMPLRTLQAAANAHPGPSGSGPTRRERSRSAAEFRIFSALY
jgi:hypothetical protein